MISHVLFISTCRIARIEERAKKVTANEDTPESYYTIVDDKDVCYLVYSSGRRLVKQLQAIMPDDRTQLSELVELSGYVAKPGGSKFYCPTSCKIYDSTLKQFRTPETPAQEVRVYDKEYEE